MGKSISFEYEGKQYTLEYNRAAIRTMEQRGFVASEMGEKPMTLLPLLFEGAFLMHHRFEKKERIQQMFDKLGDKAELTSKLVEMYNEPIETMLDNDEGNVKWSASW